MRMTKYEMKRLLSLINTRTWGFFSILMSDDHCENLSEIILVKHMW
jgi:hypothetical protein